MTRQRQKFKYTRSQRIVYWGCSYDSLLELKFAISIQSDYEFLKERITVYYLHGSNKPTDYIREGVRHYTPDFLIRHKVTGKAYWIEVKPRAAQHDPKLLLRREVAEKYIRWKGMTGNLKLYLTMRYRWIQSSKRCMSCVANSNPGRATVRGLRNITNVLTEVPRNSYP